MNATTAPEMIDVQALQIGMVVHLDGGWMAHPFALSRFKITSANQIATIRSLGLKKVRWEPQNSEAPGSDDDGAISPGDAQTATGIDPAPAAPTRQDQARITHRKRLARQRDALQLCERQFTEAASACDELTGLVRARPLDAAGQAQALSRALVDKMLGEQEMCIQLLGASAGNKASAHALNVTIMSLLLGRKLGLGEVEMLDLGVGAMLHDIGKIELQERVRQREDTFIAAEVKEYEDHVAQGVAHARKMGLAMGALLVVAQHHEQSDGGGFPSRLSGDKMTLPARIVALVNRYDRLCNPNLAAQALTPHEAMALLFAANNARFDPAVLGTFIKMMGVYPPGSLVQLVDGSHAMVVSVNSTRPLKPRVLVHDAKVPRDDALVMDLQTQPKLAIVRSLKPRQLPAPALNYLAPAKRVVYFFEPDHELDEQP